MQLCKSFHFHQLSCFVLSFWIKKDARILAPNSEEFNMKSEPKLDPKLDISIRI